MKHDKRNCQCISYKCLEILVNILRKKFYTSRIIMKLYKKLRLYEAVSFNNMCLVAPIQLLCLISYSTTMECTKEKLIQSFRSLLPGSGLLSKSLHL